ncbi:MAG: hypothetical protein B7Y42_16025 [Polaromonas sp. 28-63-22]|nr:MAG: hypothetical protein B7Y42_16025 [Polaromonas sp. 28-63-22]
MRRFLFNPASAEFCAWIFSFFNDSDHETLAVWLLNFSHILYIYKGYPLSSTKRIESFQDLR